MPGRLSHLVKCSVLDAVLQGSICQCGQSGGPEILLACLSSAGVGMWAAPLCHMASHIMDSILGSHRPGDGGTFCHSTHSDGVKTSTAAGASVGETMEGVGSG